MPPRIHVVAAVLEDPHGRVLVAQRPEGKSLAGSWEFPGGKLHAGESRLAGLARELDEELGIQVEQARARPLIRYVHRYPDLEVELDVWRVEAWAGELHGREGQALDWRLPETLLANGLLPADAVVLKALNLPAVCLVTPPSSGGDEGAFLDALETAAESLPQPLPHSLVCLRRPALLADDLLELAAGAACRIEGTGARLVLHGDPAVLGPVVANPPPELAARFQSTVAGLHVPGRYLDLLTHRPVPATMYFGASCHDARELERALALEADYAFLGPVKETASHPGAPGMGWDGFARLVAELPIPVYAIGGLAPSDLDDAWAAGAQGIAAIRGLWPSYRLGRG
jgi:8-oxo-dGTP diphosphatase